MKINPCENNSLYNNTLKPDIHDDHSLFPCPVSLNADGVGKNGHANRDWGLGDGSNFQICSLAH